MVSDSYFVCLFELKCLGLIFRGLEWGAGFYIGQGRRPQLIVCGRYIGEEWYDLVYMSFTFSSGKGTLWRIWYWW
ncbi:hypothetical protein MKX03_032681, partial [Papaver bracteatum]